VRTYTQGLLNKFPTVATCLCRETRIDSYHPMTSSCSLFFEDVEERAPTSVHDALGEMVIFDHVRDSQVFNGDALIGLCIVFGRLEMMVAALSVNLEMGLCRTSGGLTASMGVFLTPAHHTLLASQSTLRRAIETRVLNRMTLAIRKERLESYINTDVRMSATARKMRSQRFGFAHDQRIPVPICTMDEMDGLGRALKRTVQLDLEEVSELLRDDEVFLVLMQRAVFAVLPQLNGMPPIRLLEAREADTRNVIFFSREKAFQGLTEPICQHLYGGGWHLLTSSFESILKIVFGRKRLLLCILCFDGLQHLIIEHAGLSQATHKHARLFFIWVQAVFKRSHVFYYSALENICQQCRPPAGGQQFIHMLESSGPLAPFLVEGLC
jgi:hypothetical protein